MKILVISDLHIDLNRWKWETLDEIPADVNTVVVAGDISNNVFDASQWLVDLKSRFEHVIWVAGNHDFYNSGFHRTRLADPKFDKLWPMPKIVSQMYDHYSRWSIANGINFLHRSSTEINGITFIGATGWHDFVAGEPYSTDDQINTWYKNIHDNSIYWSDSMKADHTLPVLAGMDDAIAIKNLVDASTNPTMVITHHIPDRKFLWQRPEDPIWTKLHGSFVNTRLETIRDPKIKYWIYGHTHQRGMNQIDETVFVCNAKGYRGENPSWTPIIIEV
jgi:predicted phosphodiesterase